MCIRDRSKGQDQQTVLQSDLQTLVRNEIGPIACYQKTFVVPRLPKTRSGKILRKTMKHILNEQEYVDPPTIEDPTALDEIIQTIAASKS